jgi:predicted metal-binding protein
METKLREIAVRRKVDGWAMINVADIVFRSEFRAMCEANRCGHFGKGWMCPPAVGGIEEMIAEARRRTRALVFMHVGRLASSWDWKGMVATARRFGRQVGRLARDLAGLVPEPLVLGAGPCRLCGLCACATREPCRHPEKATTSLEACGIDVAQLAQAAGLNYVNGPNTVSYFGAVLY